MARVLLNTDDRLEVRDSELGLQDGDPETVYILRPLLTETHREIVKKHTTYVLNKVTHQKDAVTNTDAVVDDIYDYVLVDWRGIVDAAGKAVPCDSVSKRGLGTVIRTALLERAGLNQIKSPTEQQEDSFRRSA